MGGGELITLFLSVLFAVGCRMIKLPIKAKNLVRAVLCIARATGYVIVCFASTIASKCQNVKIST